MELNINVSIYLKYSVQCKVQWDFNDIILGRGLVVSNFSFSFSFSSQLTMNDFSVHRIIGRGGFGEVYGCRKADTGKM